MKHFLLAASFVAAVTGGTAQNLAQRVPFAPASQPKALPHMNIMHGDFAPRSQKNDGGVQASGWTPLFTAETHYFNHYYPNPSMAQNVLTYEPVSKTLYLVRNEVSGTTGSFNTKLGYLSWKGDNLVAQTPTLVWEGAGFFGRPNMQVIPTGDDDPSSFPIFFYGIQWDINGGNGVFTSVIKPTGQDAYPVPMESPLPSGYTWGHVGFDVDAANMNVYAAGYAGTLENQGQYGSYNFFAYNFTNEDFLVAEQPAAFGLSRWYMSPTAGLTSSLNTRPITRTDDNGRPYVGFNNFEIFTEGTTTDTARRFQVFTSSNQGSSWTTPANAVPTSVVSATFAAYNKDFAIQRGLTAYRNGEFIVTGEDRYSFFQLYQTARIDGDTLREIVYSIAEFEYKDNVWTGRKAADIPFVWVIPNGTDIDYDGFFVHEVVRDPFSTGDSTTLYLNRTFNDRGVEMQAARTADGNNLVLKFVAMDTTKVHEISPAIKLIQGTAGSYTDAGELTQQVSTDIFVTTRSLNGANPTWSTPYNATNDDEMNLNTYMPIVVPSLSSIPMVQVINPGTGTALANVNIHVSQTVAGAGAVSEQNFDVVNSVEPGEGVSYNFGFNTISPNPATDVAEVSFNLATPAHVTVDVVDVVGRQIGSHVASTNLDAGVHGTSINVASLSNGTYYIALTVDGKRLMKPFVVVR